jgi:hypothetical protein
MVSPVAKPVPIGALHQNRPRPVYHGRRSYHHGRAWHDYGRRVHDDRRWRDDHRRGVHRDPNTDRYPNPCMCRERQGKSCETENSANSKHAEKRFSVLHDICPLVGADYVRPFLLYYIHTDDTLV